MVDNLRIRSGSATGAGADRSAAAPERQTHRVRAGDTLGNILLEAGFQGSELRAAVRAATRINGLKNPNRIHPQQVLEIPTRADIAELAPIAKARPTAVDRISRDARAVESAVEKDATRRLIAPTAAASGPALTAGALVTSLCEALEHLAGVGRVLTEPGSESMRDLVRSTATRWWQDFGHQVTRHGGDAAKVSERLASLALQAEKAFTRGLRGRATSAHHALAEAFRVALLDASEGCHPATKSATPEASFARIELDSPQLRDLEAIADNPVDTIDDASAELSLQLAACRLVWVVGEDGATRIVRLPPGADKDAALANRREVAKGVVDIEKDTQATFRLAVEDGRIDFDESAIRFEPPPEASVRFKLLGLFPMMSPDVDVEGIDAEDEGDIGRLNADLNLWGFRFSRDLGEKILGGTLPEDFGDAVRKVYGELREESVRAASADVELAAIAELDTARIGGAVHGFVPGARLPLGDRSEIILAATQPSGVRFTGDATGMAIAGTLHVAELRLGDGDTRIDASNITGQLDARFGYDVPRGTPAELLGMSFVVADAEVDHLRLAGRGSADFVDWKNARVENAVISLNTADSRDRSPGVGFFFDGTVEAGPQSIFTSEYAVTAKGGEASVQRVTGGGFSGRVKVDAAGFHISGTPHAARLTIDGITRQIEIPGADGAAQRIATLQDGKLEVRVDGGDLEIGSGVVRYDGRRQGSTAQIDTRLSPTHGSNVRFGDTRVDFGPNSRLRGSLSRFETKAGSLPVLEVSEAHLELPQVAVDPATIPKPADLERLEIGSLTGTLRVDVTGLELGPDRQLRLETGTASITAQAAGVRGQIDPQTLQRRTAEGVQATQEFLEDYEIARINRVYFNADPVNVWQPTVNRPEAVLGLLDESDPVSIDVWLEGGDVTLAELEPPGFVKRFIRDEPVELAIRIADRTRVRLRTRVEGGKLVVPGDEDVIGELEPPIDLVGLPFDLKRVYLTPVRDEGGTITGYKVRPDLEWVPSVLEKDNTSGEAVLDFGESDFLEAAKWFSPAAALSRWLLTKVHNSRQKLFDAIDVQVAAALGTEDGVIPAKVSALAEQVAAVTARGAADDAASLEDLIHAQKGVHISLERAVLGGEQRRALAPGETLRSLTEDSPLQPQHIIAANPAIDGALLYNRPTIVGPSGEAIRVNAGDTVMGLARAHDWTPAKLLAANPELTEVDLSRSVLGHADSPTKPAAPTVVVPMVLPLGDGNAVAFKSVRDLSVEGTLPNLHITGDFEIYGMTLQQQGNDELQSTLEAGYGRMHLDIERSQHELVFSAKGNVELERVVLARSGGDGIELGHGIADGFACTIRSRARPDANDPRAGGGVVPHDVASIDLRVAHFNGWVDKGALAITFEPMTTEMSFDRQRFDGSLWLTQGELGVAQLDAVAAAEQRLLAALEEHGVTLPGVDSLRKKLSALLAVGQSPEVGAKAEIEDARAELITLVKGMLAAVDDHVRSSDSAVSGDVKKALTLLNWSLLAVDLGVEGRLSIPNPKKRSAMFTLGGLPLGSGPFAVQLARSGITGGESPAVLSQTERRELQQATTAVMDAYAGAQVPAAVRRVAGHAERDLDGLCSDPDLRHTLATGVRRLLDARSQNQHDELRRRLNDLELALVPPVATISYSLGGGLEVSDSNLELEATIDDGRVDLRAPEGRGSSKPELFLDFSKGSKLAIRVERLRVGAGGVEVRAANATVDTGLDLGHISVAIPGSPPGERVEVELTGGSAQLVFDKFVLASGESIPELSGSVLITGEFQSEGDSGFLEALFNDPNIELDEAAGTITLSLGRFHINSDGAFSFDLAAQAELSVKQ